jgi:hypothetical protein
MRRLAVFAGVVAGSTALLRWGPWTPEQGVELFRASVFGFCPMAIAFLVAVVALERAVEPRRSLQRWARDGVGPAGGPFRCPVCASAGPGPWVRCRSCETPHHADCARYAGGCGVYGCAVALHSRPAAAPK